MRSGKQKNQMVERKVKLTKSKLQQIIQEELDEGVWDMVKQVAAGGGRGWRGWQKNRAGEVEAGSWPKAHASPDLQDSGAVPEPATDPAPTPDPDLTQMLYDLGHPDDIAKVLKYTMEDVPEAKVRFKHYYDQFIEGKTQ